MNKTVSALVVSAMLSQFAIASEETKYVTDQSAKGNGSQMSTRGLIQADIAFLLTHVPVLGLLMFTTFTAVMPDVNIIDLDLVTQAHFEGLRAAIRNGLEQSSDGSSKVSEATNEIVKNMAKSFASKVKEEKAAFYANGQVDVAQTPTLFRAANEVALVKGVDTNAAAVVIINNSELLLNRTNN